jgi:uncharacterized protein YqgC (DUF456 family)
MLHIALGELVALSALWMVVELIESPSEGRIKRALAASLVLLVFSWISYVAGGYYYVNDYGPVKSVIKGGPWDWAHKIFMEVKEHIFLVGPYIAVAITALIYAYKERLAADSGLRQSFVVTLALLFLGVALVLTFGVIVSTGYRVALAAAGG